MKLEELVEQFAENVTAQTDAIWRGDARTGNKHARKYAAAFDKLRAHGDAGRDALAALFTHPRMDVRFTAAAVLLRHRTAAARPVLEQAAQGEGLVPFKAQQALQRWEEGTRALEPEERSGRCHAGRGWSPLNLLGCHGKQHLPCALRPRPVSAPGAFPGSTAA